MDVGPHSRATGDLQGNRSHSRECLFHLCPVKKCPIECHRCRLCLLRPSNYHVKCAIVLVCVQSFMFLSRTGCECIYLCVLQFTRKECSTLFMLICFYICLRIAQALYVYVCECVYVCVCGPLLCCNWHKSQMIMQHLSLLYLCAHYTKAKTVS